MHIKLNIEKHKQLTNKHNQLHFSKNSGWSEEPKEADGWEDP